MGGALDVCPELPDPPVDPELPPEPELFPPVLVPELDEPELLPEPELPPEPELDPLLDPPELEPGEGVVFGNIDAVTLRLRETSKLSVPCKRPSAELRVFWLKN